MESYKNTYKLDINKNNVIGETFTGFKNGILNNDLLEKIDYISNGRISLWNDTFKYIDYNDALLLGVGPDNFRIYHLGISDGKVVGLFYHDKAHNIYLNTLVEEYNKEVPKYERVEIYKLIQDSIDVRLKQ